MPWTESRSRDEWLAEVRRRGERMRRRRRFTVACVAAFAFVLPVSAVAGFVTGQPDRGVELSIAGPAPAGDMAPAPRNQVPSSTEPGAAGEVPTAAVGDPESPGAESPNTTVHVFLRPGAVNRSPVASMPAADDPPVRPAAPTTTTPSSLGRASSAGLPLPGSTSPSTVPATAPACPAADVRQTVATEKSAYAAGETVRGTSTLENRSSITCTLSFHVTVDVHDASGRSMDSLRLDPWRTAVAVDPGKAVRGTFTWDQRDCAGMPMTDAYPIPRDRCPQVPAGTYTVRGLQTGDPTETSLQVGA